MLNQRFIKIVKICLLTCFCCIYVGNTTMTTFAWHNAKEGEGFAVGTPIPDSIEDVYNKYGKTVCEQIHKRFGNSGEFKQIIKNALNKPNSANLTLYANRIKYYIDKHGVISNGEISGINESESIATGDVYAKETDEAMKETIKFENDSKPSWLEEEFSKFIVSLGDGLNGLMSSIDATLDNIIFGRLIRYGTNIFSFELVKGNPWGIIGIVLYTILRDITFTMTAIFIIWFFTRSAWRSGSAEARKEFKESVQRAIIVFILLAIMPRVLDALIAFKDIILHAISVQLGDLSGFSLLGNDEGGIISFYKSQTQDHHIIDALLYLGAVFITVFYSVTYLTTAVSVMVLFIFFPFVGAMSFFDSRLMTQWIKMIIGDFLMPILDTILLILPVLIKSILGDDSIKTYFVIIVTCFAVIPSRALIRMLLGVAGTPRSEMLGMGAMMAAGRLIGGMGRKAGHIKDDLKSSWRDSKADRERADLYDDLAALESEYGLSSNTAAPLSKLSSISSSFLDDESGKDKIDGLESYQLENMGDLDDINDDFDTSNEGIPDSLNNELESLSVTDMDNDINSLESEDTFIPADDELQALSSNQEMMAGDDRDILNSSINENGEIQEEQIGTSEDNIGEVASANGMASSVSSGDEAEFRDGMATLSEEEKLAIAKNNVLKKHANTRNFEDPEFQNVLNFAERAQLYRKRANRSRIGGTASAFGSFAGGMAGGAAFATVAGGANMFAGPSASLIAASTVGSMGTSIGANIGSAITTGTTNAVLDGKVAKTVKPLGDVAKTVYNQGSPSVESFKAGSQMIANGASAMANNAYDSLRSFPSNATKTTQAAFNGDLAGTTLQYNPNETVATPNTIKNFGNVTPYKPPFAYNSERGGITFDEQPDLNEVIAEMNMAREEGTLYNAPDSSFYASESDLANSVGDMLADTTITDDNPSYDDLWGGLEFSQNEFAAMNQMKDAFVNGTPDNLKEQWQQTLYQQLNEDISQKVREQEIDITNMTEEQERIYINTRAEIISHNLTNAIINSSAYANKKDMNIDEFEQLNRNVLSLAERIKNEILREKK